MKKLILAFIIIVVAGVGGYSLYKFTDIFVKSEETAEVVEVIENTNNN